jgi:hypothetical protein
MQAQVQVLSFLPTQLSHIFKWFFFKKIQQYAPNWASLWGDFLSLYSRFYEVIMLESTYVTSEKKMQVIFRC